MKINALTVCVDYADTLALMLPRFAPYLKSWTIVTTPRDQATIDLVNGYAEEHGAPADGLLGLHLTEIFYAGGALFNKGAAMEEARTTTMPYRDWILLLDADIVPEPDWYPKVVAANPQPGNLHSAYRHITEDPSLVDHPDLPRLNDDLGVGYFQLFHATDVHAQHAKSLPLIDTKWYHAGNYDDCLKQRWPRPRRVELPIRLVHVGKQDNWCGKGNNEAIARLHQERGRRGGWHHETVQNVPKG